MPPETPNVGLHHLPTHHVGVLVPITLEQGFLLFRYGSMVCLVESFFDEINDFLTLLIGQDRLWKACIQQTSYSHRMLLVLLIETPEAYVVSEVWLVLILCVEITES
jgi:hypothetical protein